MYSKHEVSCWSPGWWPACLRAVPAGEVPAHVGGAHTARRDLWDAGGWHTGVWGCCWSSKACCCCFRFCRCSGDRSSFWSGCSKQLGLQQCRDKQAGAPSLVWAAQRGCAVCTSSTSISWHSCRASCRQRGAVQEAAPVSRCSRSGRCGCCCCWQHRLVCLTCNYRCTRCNSSSGSRRRRRLGCCRGRWL